jgi:peptidoglycan/LPS O-acetylase OafA/YrhL
LNLLGDWLALFEGLVAILVSYLAVICFDEPVQAWLQRAKSRTTPTQLIAEEQ